MILYRLREGQRRDVLLAPDAGNSFILRSAIVALARRIGSGHLTI